MGGLDLTVRWSRAQFFDKPVHKNLRLAAKALEVGGDKPIRAIWDFHFERTDQKTGTKISAVQDAIAQSNTVPKFRGLHGKRGVRVKRSSLEGEFWKAHCLKPGRPAIAIVVMEQGVVP